MSYSAKFCTEGLSYKGYHQILQMQTIGANAVGSIMFHITGAETEAYYDNTYAINITGNASNIYIQSAKQISGEKLEKPLLYYKSGNTVYIHAWRGQWQDLYVTDITQNVNSACIVTWTKTDVFSTTDAILSEDYKEFEYLPAYPSDAVTTHIIGATENENVDGSYNDDLVGSNILYARADHTHLMPLAIDGIQNISNNGLMCVSAQSELNLSGSLLTIGNTTLNINSNQAYYKDKEIAVKDDIIYPKIVVETIPEQKDYTNGLKRIDFKTTRKINVDLCNGENDGYNILKLEIDGFYPIYIDISTAHTTHYLRKIGDD